MNEETLIGKRSKFDQANFLTKVYGTWLYPLFFRGLKKDLELKDIYKLPKDDYSAELVDKFEKNWKAELKKKSPSFARVSFKTFGIKLVPSFILMLIAECVMDNTQIILLGQVLKFLANPNEERYDIACICAAGMVSASLIFSLVFHPAMLLAIRVAIKIRVSWCTLMYKKALKLKHSAFGKTTIGQILNLMSNDVSRLDEYCLDCSYTVIAPIQVIIGLTICWQYLGPICLIGFGLLFCFIPFNGLMGRLFLKIRTKVAALSDNRIRLMNEIIKGMRVIKMYAWEKHFDKLISSARKKELSEIKKSILLKALNNSISHITPRIVIFVVLTVHVLMGGRLSAESVFVTMSIFNSLRFTMCMAFPQCIALAAELYVSCKRIQKYLQLEEIGEKSNQILDKNQTTKQNDLIDTKVNQLNNDNQNEYSVLVENMSATWNPELLNLTLTNITANLKPGELLAVIGPVGSGKSSFLMSLLNEIEVTSGQVSVKGSIAYASQESWSFNSSILQNILFGKEYDSKRFKEVISVCALNRDFKLFPFAENTLVGERGVSLSGGQKARLTLARALYNDADIYLLDDPLSAVDSEVANHIFEKCISEYLSSKTVILVTHQIQFIKKATKILVLKEGQTLALDSYEELMNRGIDFMSLIKEEKSDKQIDINEEQKCLIGDKFKNRSISVLSTDSEADIEVSEQKIDEENKANGSINSIVYWDYIRAGAGPILLIFGITSTLVSQALMHYSDIWLSDWTNREDQRNKTSDTTIDDSNNIKIYSILVAITFVTLIVRSGTFFLMCINASVNLHNRIFYCLMRTPIAFFDNNPIGRILNRFTKDVGIIDEQLPITAYDMNTIFMQLIGSQIVVSIVNPYLIIPAFVLFVLILIIRWIYLKSGRDLKRFEGIARSPLYNHMSITLSGLVTIRAFRAQQLFKQQYYRYQDNHTSTYFMCVAASRGLGVAMDWICVSYIVIVALFLMIFHSGLASGSAGLALIMALGLTGMTQWGVRQSAEVENQMTSVERILEYSRLESEADLETLVRPPDQWPQNGSIVLSNVSLTYQNSDKPTLHCLNCEIRGGEKVGIVGRTGAGKSSILAALFRMHEIVGTISIDGIDCRTIGLHSLRKSMSIIPQDPIAFIGSLRKNLDPFDEHSEDQIWAALEEVQLKNAVNEMPEKLDYLLAESGANLSVGQRQLICLGRAILRRNRILVLDEATANVDHKTDALIQTTIRQNFAECTVLTIAHRLNSIIDSDRVLVLDSGRIVEFGRPYHLLNNKNGMFSKLVEQTGEQMATDLFRAAEEAFNKSNVKSN